MAANPKVSPINSALAIEWWDVDRPKDYPLNARKWKPEAVAKVAMSLETYGWRQPIVVDKAEVIAIGHLRRAAARQAGMRRVPVHVAADLSPEEIRGLRLADNRTHDEAEWDTELLAREFGELKALDFDLGSTAFSLREIDSLTLKPDPNEDDVPPVPEVPVTKPGDLWVMGAHRLLCGDATKAEDVERLMRGKEAKLLWTDPPYGVDYGDLVSSRKNQKIGGWADIAGDGLDDSQLLALLSGSLSAPGATIAFVWHPAGARRFLFWEALKLNGWKPAQEVVWVKNALVFGRADYQWRHEPCIYARRGTVERQLDRTETTVWEADKPHNSGHPTQKPVSLCSRPIKNHTTPGDIVFDPFCGSGTCVIAAEQSGRFGYGIEIEPRYVDCAVTRWESLTGKTATLDETHQTFAQVAQCPR